MLNDNFGIVWGCGNFLRISGAGPPHEAPFPFSPSPDPAMSLAERIVFKRESEVGRNHRGQAQGDKMLHPSWLLTTNSWRLSLYTFFFLINLFSFFLL